MQLRLLLMLICLLCSTCLIARDHSNDKFLLEQFPDSEVLETVLIDLLHHPKSPVEDQTIYFSKAPLMNNYIAKKLLKYFYDPVSMRYYYPELMRLSAEQLAMSREATQQLVSRVEENDFWDDFVPKDPRITLFSKDVSEEKEQNPWIGYAMPKQIFKALPPGYSKNKKLAFVCFRFSWSGGRHWAEAKYILIKQKTVWSVLRRDLTFGF